MRDMQHAIVAVRQRILVDTLFGPVKFTEVETICLNKIETKSISICAAGNLANVDS
jgi:hypothetical protein